MLRKLYAAIALMAMTACMPVRAEAPREMMLESAVVLSAALKYFGDDMALADLSVLEGQMLCLKNKPKARDCDYYEAKPPGAVIEQVLAIIRAGKAEHERGGVRAFALMLHMLEETLMGESQAGKLPVRPHAK